MARSKSDRKTRRDSNRGFSNKHCDRVRIVRERVAESTDRREERRARIID